MEHAPESPLWKTCLAEWGPPLLLFARQWAATSADAEDIVQDAFVRFWRRGAGVADRPLLFAAVRSAGLDRLRREGRRARRERAALAGAEEFCEPVFANGDDEDQRALAQAVARLPAEQREVLVLKIWNDMTFAEIALVLAIPANTAASRYRYALAALKRSLQPHG